jgi:ATP-dependent DNA helicase RecG
VTSPKGASKDVTTALLDAVWAGTPAGDLESETVDFKQQKSDVKEACTHLAEAAVCFANSGGGLIVVGISDRPGGENAFLGSTLDPTMLRARIYRSTSPGLLVEVEEVRYRGIRLLAVTVPEGLDVYSSTKGIATQRIGDQCLPMRPDEITRLSEERKGVDWSAKSSGRSPDDVDPFALRYCQRLLANSADPARQRYARLSDTDLLRVLQATADDGRLTHAGELLLCGGPLNDSIEAVVYQHRRTPGGEPDAILRLETPLVIAFEELNRAIRSRQGITPVTLADGQQIQIEDYPEGAVREAIANAFIHGDWRMRVPVQVDHSPAYLGITSPGPLVAGITVNNILTKGSRLRYPALAHSFRLLGLAEEVGQGIDRMYREMIRSGRDVPAISEESDQVSVRFKGQPPNTRIARFLAALPDQERDDTDALLIIRYLCGKRTTNASEIAPIVQRPPEEAQAALLRLATEPLGVLEPTRGTIRRTFPSYRLRAAVITSLGAAVAYHSRATDDIDKKVIEHVRDYGDINNRTVQRLFDVDVYQARDILRDLVGREILTRTSTQKRGTAVRYGPGPAYPRRTARRRKPSGADG